MRALRALIGAASLRSCRSAGAIRSGLSCSIAWVVMVPKRQGVPGKSPAPGACARDYMRTPRAGITVLRACRSGQSVLSDAAARRRAQLAGDAISAAQLPSDVSWFTPRRWRGCGTHARRCARHAARDRALAGGQRDAPAWITSFAISGFSLRVALQQFVDGAIGLIDGRVGVAAAPESDWNRHTAEGCASDDVGTLFRRTSGPMRVVFRRTHAASG